MNKVLKISLIIVIAFSILSAYITPVLGTDYLDPDTVLQKANDTTSTVPGQVQTVAGTILAIAQVVGVSVALVMLIYLAIKYMSSAPEAKAEIKKHAVVYVVGAVVLFGASALLGIISDFAKNI